MSGLFNPKNIDELTEITNLTIADNDVIPVRDISVTGTDDEATKKITVANLATKINAGIDLSSKQDVVSGVSSTEIGYLDGVTSAIQTQLNAKQAVDADLTTIAGLTATTDNVMQSKSGAWSSRTPAQLQTDLPQLTSAIEMYEDFLFPKITSGYCISNYAWRGVLVDWTAVAGMNLTGTVGCATQIAGTSTHYLYLDGSSADVPMGGSTTAPGFYVNMGNITTSFRFSRINSGAGTVTQYCGYFSTPKLPATAYGAFFRITDSGYLVCVNKDATGEEATTTAVTLANSTWVKLEMRTNAAGTQMTFYINDTLVATHTTHIYAETTLPAIGNVFTYAGTNTSGEVYLDYWFLRVTGINRL